MVVAELQVVVTTHHALAGDVLQKRNTNVAKQSKHSLDMLFLDSHKDGRLEKSLLKLAMIDGVLRKAFRQKCEFT